MKQFYVTGLFLLSSVQFLYGQLTQDCSAFTATYSTTESRCASTGTITVTATGGSGNYSYRITEPFNLPLTSSSTISGLAPGTYTIHTKDMETGCTLVRTGVIVSGSYNDPRFQLVATDVTCIGGNNGTISVVNQQHGRPAFSYTIIAPSPYAVNTTNSTGNFSNLRPGEYFIQLRDSCGGIQTRSVTIQDYNWNITSSPVSKTNCNTVSITINLSDNKGNTNTTGATFNSFRYGVVNSTGDTTWYATRSFSVSRTPLRSLTFVVKDNCGTVRRINWNNNVPSAGAGVNIANRGCNTFSVNATSLQNFTNPQYTLKQGTTVIQTGNNSTFHNVPYGSYCLEIRDACYDTTITRCFTATAPVPSVNATVSISSRACATFRAAITDPQNLFNPTYYLYSSTNTLITHNTSGVFSNLPYGAYSIRAVSSAPCYDTTIVRHFSEAMPRPSVNASLSYTNSNCSGFTASITGQNNLFSPSYCLFRNGIQIDCNNTGTFTNLSYDSSYCIRIISAAPCYDTTIERCFTRPTLTPSASHVGITQQNCSSFTATIGSVTNMPSPEYCLFTNAGSPLGCNTSGVFNNLPYGSYYIDIVSTNPTDACPATSVRRYFSAARPTPSIDANVSINRSCATFSASITGQQNLFNPQFCLYNSSNTLVECNESGTFSSIPYGRYSIITTIGCGATITRNFTVAANPMSISVNAANSCTIGRTNLSVAITSTAEAPYTARVINPLNQVVATQSFNTSNYTFTGLAALGSSLQYRVVVNGNCNTSDTVAVTPQASIFERSIQVNSKCPSAQTEAGAGNLSINLHSNIGFFAPTIIRKNGSNVTITNSSNSNLSPSVRRYEFLNLEPATYVLEYTITSCSMRQYDTVTISNYQFPNLNNSAAYQCDNNNFSVNAVVTGGAAPFTYEIIGSNPTGPSIVTSPQASPIFSINTGQPYSLVRMRAVDACGNGTLNDISILPLGELRISSNNIDCYSNNITMTVDTIANASYRWYRKTSATDSTLVTTSFSYNIPWLSPADTGVYVCKTIVNDGCLIRLSYFDLKGNCSITLPVEVVTFGGTQKASAIHLNWDTKEEKNISTYVVEQSSGKNNTYQEIGRVSANGNAVNKYAFVDQHPAAGTVNYRLRIISDDGKVTYSKSVSFNNETAVYFEAMPNPVSNVLHVKISSAKETAYKISIINLNGQELQSQQTGRVTNKTITLHRGANITKGMYFVKVSSPDNPASFIKKILFD